MYVILFFILVWIGFFELEKYGRDDEPVKTVATVSMGFGTYRGREVHQGPRGGLYVLSNTGRKRYVPRWDRSNMEVNQVKLTSLFAKWWWAWQLPSLGLGILGW